MGFLSKLFGKGKSEKISTPDPIVEPQSLPEFDLGEVKEISDPIDAYGWSQLMNACEAGNLDAVKSELERGVKVDRKNKAGATALTIASEHGKTDIVNLLIDKGAAINVPDIGGWTPLLIATSKGQQWTAFALIEKGADVNVKNNRGSTPLTFSAEKGWSGIAQKLVEAGADVNYQLPNGTSALDLATRNGHQEIIELLGRKDGAKGTVKEGLFQWKRTENPMGFSMPWPKGWERVQGTDSVLLIPPSAREIREGFGGSRVTYSPCLSLVIGGPIGKDGFRSFAEIMSRTSSSILSQSNKKEREWIKLVSGDEALYVHFTEIKIEPMKDEYVFVCHGIQTRSEKNNFTFEISGRAQEIDELGRENIKLMLKDFVPSI